MSDRRLEILKAEYYKYFRPSFPSDERTYAAIETTLCIKEETDAIKTAMDIRATELCLELLEYMAKNKVICGHYSSIDGLLFKVNGHELLTKEQLFGNFL